MTKRNSIAIATLYRGPNIGTIVQAAALRTFLRGALGTGVNVYVIEHAQPESIFFQAAGALKSWISKNWPYLKIESGLSEHYVKRDGGVLLQATANRARLSPLIDAVSRARPDAIVVGSDTVIAEKYDFVPNCEAHAKTNYFTEVARLDIPTLGMSLSADPVNLKSDRRTALRHLDDFLYITARDAETARVVAAVTGSVPPATPDPTVLVDIRQMLRLPVDGDFTGTRIVGFHLPTQLEKQFANMMQIRGIESLNLKSVRAWTVKDAVAKLEQCHTIVSDRYHVLLLGMLVARASPWFVETSKWVPGHSKGRDLLRSLGLSNHVVSDETLGRVDVAQIAADIPDRLQEYRRALEQNVVTLIRVLRGTLGET